ncbi:MAG TPA: hypothetical protein VGR01_12825 [Burkholderiales bacterium]|jgi:hypothetical protein|nr:hypothetical protein [Burkholderiales bacterium]
MKARTVFLTFATTMLASGAAVSAEGPVVWADSTCDYFIIQLPEGNPAEAFGLFRSNTKSIPKVGDIVEGDIVAAYKVDVTDKATGQKYSLLHWANGKSEETLVRHSPVYCSSRYKKRE